MKRGRLIANLVASSALAGTARAADVGDYAHMAVTARTHAAAPENIGAPRRPEPEPVPYATMLASLSPAAAQTGAAVLAAQAAGEAPEAPAIPANEEVLFEADLVTREDDASPIVAEGNVAAYFGATYLRADRLVYDPATDIVVAEGSVSLTDRGGETVFANRVELTGDLRDGVAENFSALLADNAKLAAHDAIREQGARTMLSRAVYTACDVCKKSGEPKVPTWRIKAFRVTRDEEYKVIRFRHAFFELKGVPIFYAPFLQGPDPSMERQSGFLTPVIGASSRLGFNLQAPYYLAISNHQDATFAPKYTSRDGVLWQGEYRRMDRKGEHVIQAGAINYEDDPTTTSDDGVPSVRWHVFASGHRDFGDNWRAGYDIERVSDNTYLRRYGVERRGDLAQEIRTSRTNRLRSNVYSVWRNDQTEFTADAYWFQGLRSQDDASLTPYVLPLLNARHEFADAIAGGRAHVAANFAALRRTGGADGQRMTASAYWDREHITGGGHRFEAFAELRGDAFYYQDLNQGTETISRIRGDDTRFVARFAPSAGLEWSYPLVRRFDFGRVYIEPRAQIVASPSNRNPDSILNEDSQSIEFDYAGLFDFNKATGYDVFEDGQRANVGVTASVVFDNGFQIETQIGEQFRLQSTDAFDTASGLGEERSDIVGALNVRYKNLIRVENRFRLDDDTGELRRVESTADFRWWRVNASLAYVRLADENRSQQLVRREEVVGDLTVKLTRNWSTGMTWRENLVSNTTIRQDFVLGYTDECASIDLIFRRDFTRDVGLVRDTAFLIRFSLRSLGDWGSPRV